MVGVFKKELYESNAIVSSSQISCLISSYYLFSLESSSTYNQKSFLKFVEKIGKGVIVRLNMKLYIFFASLLH